MKAIICSKLSGFENLTIEEIKPPILASGEVLVEVSKVALNFFDTLITKGQYQDKPPLPFSPGGEISGIVKDVSPEVRNFSIGDRVMAYVGWGGLQQQVTVNAEKAIKIPDNVTDELAAAVSITYGTAMHGLMERANIKENDTVVILGAAGGAGLAAIEVAKAIGAKIIAVASTEEKIALAISYGAHDGILSGSSDLKTEIKSKTNNKGADIIYDCVGGDLAEPCLRALNWHGRYLVVGFASGTIPSLPLNLVMLKGCHVSGVFWGRFIKEQPEEHAKLMQQLLSWCENGQITPHIHKVYPFEETVSALRIIAERQAEGKILIDMQTSK